MLHRLALCAAAVLALSACGDAASGDSAAPEDRLDVIVGAYPYEFVVERVGGDAVRVQNVTEPGAEPHDVELTAQQVAAVAEADLVVHSSGFQPALDDALAQHGEERGLDVLSVVRTRTGEDAHDEHGEHEEEGHADERHEEEGHEEEAVAVDPHLWLDPKRLAAVADAVAERLADQAPDEADGIRDRAQDLRSELEALDGEFRDGLASCARDELVTSHAAFGYLADEYGLEQVALSGLSPEAEPSPRRLAEVAEYARANGVTTVFFEELVSPRVAEQLAREVGATATVLSPLEGAPEEGDYLSAMRDNLAALQTALDCA